MSETGSWQIGQGGDFCLILELFVCFEFCISACILYSQIHLFISYSRAYVVMTEFIFKITNVHVYVYIKKN